MSNTVVREHCAYNITNKGEVNAINNALKLCHL